MALALTQTCSFDFQIRSNSVIKKAAHVYTSNAPPGTCQIYPVLAIGLQVETRKNACHANFISPLRGIRVQSKSRNQALSDTSAGQPTPKNVQECVDAIPPQSTQHPPHLPMLSPIHAASSITSDPLPLFSAPFVLVSLWTSSSPLSDCARNAESEETGSDDEYDAEDDHDSGFAGRPALFSLG